VARAHDVNANLVFKWIRRSREGWRDRRRALRRSPGADTVGSFVPVRLIEPTALKDAAAGEGRAPSRQPDPSSSSRFGAIDIRLPNGAQVRVEEGVDSEALRLVLSTLSGL
jgi:transposase